MTNWKTINRDHIRKTNIPGIRYLMHVHKLQIAIKKL
jgi:hypothetical protein